MGRIHVLDQHVAELIAAGEVVGTPLLGDQGAPGKCR